MSETQTGPDEAQSAEEDTGASQVAQESQADPEEAQEEQEEAGNREAAKYLVTGWGRPRPPPLRALSRHRAASLSD